MPVIAHDSAAFPGSLDYLKVPLYEHQKRVLQAAIDLEGDSRIQLTDNYNVIENLVSNVGFISCPPGAGKSLVMLTLALQNVQSAVSSGRNYTLTSGSLLETVLPIIDCNLFVLPDMVIPQWEEYIKTFLNIPESDWLLFKDQTAFQNFVGSAAHTGNFPTIMLCTPEIHNLVVSTYHFKRVIYDEVDTIKIPACKAVVADRIWCLSSNTERIKEAQVVNRGFLRQILSEFRSIAVRFGSFIWDKIIIHTDPAYLQLSVSLPNYNWYELSCKSEVPMTIAMTTDCIKSILINGLQHDMCSQLGITMVAEKLQAVTHLTHHKKSELEAYYNVPVTDTNIYYENNAINVLENIFTKQSSLLKEIMDIKERIMNATTCPITHSDIESPIITSCCHNSFETSFLIPWIGLYNNCPLCRKNIGLQDLVFCNTFVTPTYKTRFEYLIDIIAEVYTSGQNRLMIYAGESIAQIRDFLWARKIVFSEFRGRILRRTLSQFEKGTPQILLADIKSFSTGLNIQFATHMLIFEPATSIPQETFFQCIGRAHRIGRTLPLSVYTVKSM
jgi:hypothetical protein